jgi:2-methylcitrate dehydratase PrpD
MNTPEGTPSFLAAWDACSQRARSAVSPAAAEAARRSWLDTLAATAAGTVESNTQAALGTCTTADARQLPPLEAALVLGTASHALDYDDVCMLATCHPSGPVASALLALLPQLDASRPGLTLQDLLAAYLVGTETMLRLGAWLGFRHYALGFHATSTLGTVGVAAAAAHALGLPSAQAHAALSIAASSASGLRANFGTDTKPLHAGFAASDGLRAAFLAHGGASASDDVWGPKGFALAFNGGEQPAAIAWTGAEEWAIVQPGFEHKRFPSCYLTHRLIAGILRIRSRLPEARRTLPVKIEIQVSRDGLAALKYQHARTGLEGKFSGHYCAAAAWIDGRVELTSFTDGAVRRAQLQEQMKHVLLSERSAAGETLDTAPVQVAVHGDGWTERITVDWAPGSMADPMTREQMEHKWRDCVQHAGLDIAPFAAMLDASPDTPAASLLQPLRSQLLAAAAARSQAQRPATVKPAGK